MKIFKDDDRGYKRRIGLHPNGYVLNTGRTGRSRYVKLHRADCRTIAPTDDKQWTHQWIKVCSTDVDELADWARDKRGGKEPEMCGCQNT